MNIFVVGANGQIGRHLIEDLAKTDHQVTAGVRNVAKQSLVEANNVTYVSFDLTWTVEEMSNTFKKIDTVIFAAGSQGKNLLQVDLDGAIKTIRAAEQAAVKRYLMISAVFADNPANWPDSMIDYYITKHYADEWLKNQTTLDYVIIQPVTLTNEEKVSHIQLTAPGEQAAKTISRQTVAAFLSQLVDTSAFSRKTIVLSEGTEEIAKTLAK